ncbi:unnamed protein product, partial [Iphiclides podalirius]
MRCLVLLSLLFIFPGPSAHFRHPASTGHLSSSFLVSNSPLLRIAMAIYFGIVYTLHQQQPVPITSCGVTNAWLKFQKINALTYDITTLRLYTNVTMTGECAW